MALTPIPNEPIGNTFQWREWLFNLSRNAGITSVNIVAANGFSGTTVYVGQTANITINKPTYIDFDTVTPVTATVARVWWDSADDTLAIGHTGGVTQQVGLETYYRAGNITGVLIPNGTCVGFGGSSGGNVTAQPYIADGTMPSLYSMGIATQDIVNGGVGRVTAFGHVHDLDTTGTPVGEVWAVGDILYASPTTAGKLTNVKPTAPNIVVPIAAVLTVNATTGILLVRPTQTLQLYYGAFQCTTSPTVAAINTAYTVPFDTVSASSGVSIGVPSSRLVAANAGQYDVSISVQAVKSSAALGYVWVWLRKNGVDIANSATRTTLSGSSAEAVVTRSQSVSLAANDYIEICYAADSTATSLTSQAATAFAPAATAVSCSITQVNQ